MKEESLYVESTWYSTKAIRILSNLLVSNNDQIMFQCLSNGILDIYNKILGMDNSFLKQEAQWGLSNIACHNEQVADHFMKHDVFKSTQK